MKRFAAVLLTLAVLLCPSVRAAGPGISAASAILIDGESGRVLYAQNAEEERPIASITKLMTALVAVESHPDLSEVVTIRPEWTGVEGSSMYLKAGEELTLEALLYGLLLASGNDAAVAIAGFCAGDVDTFVAWMNDKAAELGMEHTHFENPNGLNDEGHYSTAADMAALARVVMEHEALAKIVGTRSITVAGRTLTNHNKLLWRYEGCTGLKTGYTDRAGRTLVSCAERDGQRLIAVTLNDPNDWADHAALFDYGFAHYRSAMLALANRTFRMLPVTGSLNRFVPVYTASDVYYPLTEGELVKARVELPERVEAPIQGGTIAGRLLFTLDGAVIGETYLLYAGDVADDRAGRGLFGRVLDWVRAGEADTLATVCCRWISDSNLSKGGSGHGRAAAENPFGPRRVLPAGGGGLSLRRAGDGKRMYRAGGGQGRPGAGRHPSGRAASAAARPPYLSDAQQAQGLRNHPL